MFARTFTHKVIRDDLVSLILSGQCAEGDRLPSTRTISSETGAHCQTIAKAFKPLLDSGIIEKRAGLGMFVAKGGPERLRKHAKQHFIHQRIPRLLAEAKRLHLSADDLQEAISHHADAT